MTVDHRKEPRYPCICLNVLLSPATGKNVDKLAESYLHATSHDMSISGMSFDVIEPIDVDSELIVSVPNDSDVNDQLRAIVCWCRQLVEGHYRVGVVFDVEAGIKESIPETKLLPVLHGPGIPTEATMVCPACQTLANFTYIDTQVSWDGKGELPLYSCSSCKTTRSITNLLSFNRGLSGNANE